MEFLGKLGIDWQLLIAQIINFGILVFILAKFLYKPVVSKIEKEEGKLEEAENKLQKVQKKKEDLSEKSEKITEEAKEKSRNIIEEAEQIAESVKQKAKEEAKKQKEEILREARVQAEQVDSQIEEDKYRELKGKILDRTLRKMNEILDEDTAEVLRNRYVERLIDKLSKITENDLAGQDIWAALESTHTLKEGERNGIQDALKDVLGEDAELNTKENKKLERLIDQLSEITENDLGEQNMPVVLESAHILKEEERNRIQEILESILGEDAELNTKENKDLICGFKLQIKGLVIEENMAKEIGNTIDSLDI